MTSEQQTVTPANWFILGAALLFAVLQFLLYLALYPRMPQAAGERFAPVWKTVFLVYVEMVGVPSVLLGAVGARATEWSLEHRGIGLLPPSRMPAFAARAENSTEREGAYAYARTGHYIVAIVIAYAWGTIGVRVLQALEGSVPATVPFTDLMASFLVPWTVLWFLLVCGVLIHYAPTAPEQSRSGRDGSSLDARRAIVTVVGIYSAVLLVGGYAVTFYFYNIL